MISISVTIIIMVVEAFIIAVAVAKGLKQLDRANYWKNEYIKLRNNMNDLQQQQIKTGDDTKW